MKGIPDLNRYLSNLTPARRAAAVYSTVFTVIGLSNYLFIRFRPPLYEYNAFFPETGGDKGSGLNTVHEAFPLLNCLQSNNAKSPGYGSQCVSGRAGSCT